MNQETHPHKIQRPMRTLPSQPASASHLQATVPGAAVRYDSASTVPNPVQQVVSAPQPQPRSHAPIPAPPPPMAHKRPDASARQSTGKNWLIAGLIIAVTSVAAMGLLMVMGLMIVYGNGTLPGVSAGGVDLGGKSQQEAAAILSAEWRSITVSDEERQWHVDPSELGITLDAVATAADAYAQGRGSGNLLSVLFGSSTVAPHISFNTTALENGLNQLAEQVNVPAANAGVRLVNGSVEATAPRDGRELNVAATMQTITQDGAAALADGQIELVMNRVVPTLVDATPILAEAQRLLGNPLTVRVYDPVTGDIINWTQSPENWATWLTASSDGGALALSVDPVNVQRFLQDQARVLDETRYIDFDEAVTQIRESIQAKNTRPTIRVYHHDRQHTVTSGESIISIAWDYGVPYPWVQQANPGVDVLSVGQTITIPSPDNFLPFEAVPDKRIVVSISQQRAWVYENGQVKWEWAASTGIQSSPTWPGIYQIISHVPNAYAANWNLYMPNFMGVYQPVPGADFTNGFHGFPTRGGGQLLWENSLGTKVTYGCILLSNTHVQLLYEWAEEGVVVEIQP